MTKAKPRALIYFCCQGGACKGYENAGFDVWGSDIKPQPNYLNPEKFILANALEHLDDLITTGEIEEWDFVGGSPPCQRKTRCQRIRGREHPALIAPFRELLIKADKPYIIENVVPEGYDDDPLIDPVMLCGAMFPGLRTYRHRLFESNVKLTVPEHTWVDGPTVKMGRPLYGDAWYHAIGHFSNVPYVRRNMGVPWMTRDGISECVPPVYTEYLGKQIFAFIRLGVTPSG